VFANELRAGLRKFAPDAPFDLVSHSVEAIWSLPPAQHAGVIHAYVGVNIKYFCNLVNVVLADISPIRLLIQSSLSRWDAAFVAL
jgi:hypothetical protein